MCTHLLDGALGFLKLEVPRILGESLRRSKFEIQLELLKLLARDGPQRLTHIMYKANLNCGSLKEYLHYLIEHNLIEARTLHKNRIVYATTYKGMKAVKHLRELETAMQIGFRYQLQRQQNRQQTLVEA